MVNFLPADQKSLEEAERRALDKAKNQKVSADSSSNDLTRPNFAELSKMADSQSQPKKLEQPIHAPQLSAPIKSPESSEVFSISHKLSASKNLPAESLSTALVGPNIISEKSAGFFSSLIKKIFSKKISSSVSSGPEEETLNVNLLPEQFQQASEIKEKVVFLGALAVSAVVLVVAGWGVFSLLTKAKLAERGQYEEKIKTENKIVSDLKREIQETNSRGRQVLAIQQILESRRNILAFLKELEKRTLSTVHYDGLSLSEIMNLTLMTKAPTLEDATKQYNIFKNSPELFKDVSVSQFSSKDKGGVSENAGTSFALTLTINPKIYQQSIYPFFNNAVTESIVPSEGVSEVPTEETKSLISPQDSTEIVPPITP